MTERPAEGGGRAEGLEEEGGGVCVPSAQAPRGARGGGAGLAAPHAAAAAASSLCVCWCSAQFFWGQFKEVLAWEPVDNWVPDPQNAV